MRSSSGVKLSPEAMDFSWSVYVCVSIFLFYSTFFSRYLICWICFLFWTFHRKQRCADRMGDSISFVILLTILAYLEMKLKRKKKPSEFLQDLCYKQICCTRSKNDDGSIQHWLPLIRCFYLRYYNKKKYMKTLAHVKKIIYSDFRIVSVPTVSQAIHKNAIKIKI